MRNKLSIDFNSGVSMFSLTALTLAVLKILGKISLSWWWIAGIALLPFIIALLLLIIGLIIAYMINK